MEFRRVLALRGPNLWAYFPVLEAWIDLGVRKDLASTDIPGFNERLMSWFPSMIEHRCSVGERGGFFERLRRGTYLAHILEHVTLELQNLAGADVGYGKARASSEDGVYKVVVEYEEEDVARAAIEVGRQLLLAAIEGQDFDVAGEVEKLRKLNESVRLDPITAAVVEAARRRGIPRRRLEQNLVQLGCGSKQRRIWRGQTDAVSALGSYVAESPRLSRKLLQSIGVPVAEDAEAASVDPKINWRLFVVNGKVLAYLSLVPGSKMLEVGPAIHADTLEMVADAAGVVGLQTATVDITVADLAQPLTPQGGMVRAVSPRLELPASDDASRLEVSPVLADALVGQLFSIDDNGRIPIVAVSGVNGKTTTTRLIAHIIGRTGRCVGMTCTEGIHVGGRRVESGDCSGPLSAATVLQNGRVDAAVLETARGGILRAGLGFDRCSVAVMTNIGAGDHLGISDIETAEDLATVKRTIVDVVLPGGAAVLKADDPLVAPMAAHCKAPAVFFAVDGTHPVIVEHRKKNGRAAFVRDKRMILAEGEQEIPLATLDSVPMTQNGRIRFQIENALAAAAATWSLGIPCEVIRAALASFGTTLGTAPGRFNLVAVDGITVIVDYGHNSSALQCLIETIAQLPHRKRSTVYAAAGDRRDDDIIEQGKLLGDAFDRVIIYDDPSFTRGRNLGDTSRLFRAGMAQAARVQQIHDVMGGLAAAEFALAAAAPGELLLLQVDKVDETIELIRRHLVSRGGREIDFATAIELGRAEDVAPRADADLQLSASAR